jgi:hypothetical protein
MLRFLRSEHGSALLLNEMQLKNGHAVVDVAAIDSSLHAYEIKSDLDSLARLPRQAESYKETCDFITLVTTRRTHGRHVPDDWGVLLASLSELDQSLSFEWVRRPTKNLLNARSLLHVLRSTELRRILRANGQSRIAALSKENLVDAVALLLGHDVAREIALNVLRTRKTWSIRQLGVYDEDERLRHAISQPAPQLSVLQMCFLGRSA